MQVVEPTSSDHLTHSNEGGATDVVSPFVYSGRVSRKAAPFPHDRQPSPRSMPGGFVHGGGAGKLNSLLKLPFLAELASRRTGVRLTVARIIIFAAALTLELLLGEQRTHADERLRSKCALLCQALRSAVVTAGRSG
jgi:hypothetical protein